MQTNALARGAGLQPLHHKGSRAVGNVSVQLAFGRCVRGRAARLPGAGVQAAAEPPRHNQSQAMTRALSGDLDEATAPFMEPFVRSFILGVGAGALLEGGHIALQVLAGHFPGLGDYSPLLFADHVTAFASWICLYAVEAVAILTVLKRFNWDSAAAAKDIKGLTTLPKKMLPLRLRLFERFYAPQTAALAAPSVASAATIDISAVDVSAAAPAALAEVAAPVAITAEVGAAPTSTAPPKTPHRLARAQGTGTITPLPRTLAPHRPPLPPLHEDDEETRRKAQHAKRAKELRDRQGYLKNVWYAAALSDKVKKDPVKVQLCGKEMVLWRDATTGEVRCIDNACPHRGAPLSAGWVEEKEGHSCVVCPYHGWALDGQGTLHDVPAAVNKGEWPKRALMDSYPVEEKGGFVWLFFGSVALPAEERPPIPYVPELDDPTWKPVYEEMEFECNHFGVFENAIDMAHIHYLHGDSFGNSGKPEITDMEASADAFSVTASFKICNKPVNAFWALFQVPVVEVTAKAFLPSTSLVSFTLANGLSFITFVNTVPISANKSVNRFALVRQLKWDRSGLFNARAWDKMARDAMIKILSEDKAMVEQLNYRQLPAEYSVRADLPQVQFRKLRQQWADLVGVLPTEEERPSYTVSNRDM